MDNPKITYYKNGNVKNKYWLNNGTCHKLGGPAEIWYYENDIIKSKYWYVNGKLHNFNGPAILYYDENGNVKSEYWYVNGTEIKQPFDNYPLTKNQQIELKLLYA